MLLQAVGVTRTFPVTIAELLHEVGSVTRLLCLFSLTNNSISRAAPAKLDTSLMKEPRMIHGAPRVSKAANTARRKPLPRLMNGLAISPPS